MVVAKLRKAALLIVALLICADLAAQCPHQQKILGKGISNSNSKIIGEKLGRNIALAGDVNGDGYPDVMSRVQRDVSHQFSSFPSVQLFSAKDGTFIDTFSSSDALQHFFGEAMAAAGDLNGDGKGDIVVGSRGVVGESTPGKAFLYSPASGTVLAQLSSGLTQEDHFGTSVAAVGDLDGDGRSEILVGAPFANDYDHPEWGNGWVYIYRGTGELFDVLPPPIPDGSSTFGSQVLALGDINGDGYGDFAVSDPTFDGDTSNDPELDGEWGLLALYSGRDLILNNNPYLALLAGDPNTRFGTQLAKIGDLNGDGRAEIVASTEPEAEGAASQLFCFSFTGTSWPLTASLQFFVTISSNESLGIDFDGSPDLSGDGKPDLIVGLKNGVNSGDVDDGQTRIYSGANGALFKTIISDAVYTSSDFGASVAALGDANKDGFNDIAVGVPGDWEGNNSVFGSLDPYPQAGRISIYSFSGDSDGDGIMDVCEVKSPPGGGGGGSGGGGSGGGGGSSPEAVPAISSWKISPTKLKLKGGKPNVSVTVTNPQVVKRVLAEVYKGSSTTSYLLPAQGNGTFSGLVKVPKHKLKKGQKAVAKKTYAKWNVKLWIETLGGKYYSQYALQIKVNG